MLTRRGRLAHIYVSKKVVIGSDNGILPERRQAINWTNAGILLIGSRNSRSKTRNKIHQCLHKKDTKNAICYLQTFCIGLEVLINATTPTISKFELWADIQDNDAKGLASFLECFKIW